MQGLIKIQPQSVLIGVFYFQLKATTQNKKSGTDYQKNDTVNNNHNLKNFFKYAYSIRKI